MAYSHVEALKECYVWDESEQDWYMETVWEGDDPYDGDTDTHNAYYLTDVNDEHSGTPINSSAPLDCYLDGSDTFFVYDLNGTWVDHSLHQLYKANISSWHFNDDYKTYIEPHDLAPGDTTNKLTINGQEIDIQIGDCIIFYDSNKKISDCFDFLANDALHNFTRYNYDIDPEQTYTEKQHSYRAAWYIAPGVWSNVSGANDPKHRILLGNTYAISYENPEGNSVNDTFNRSDFKVVLPRFVIEPENIQPGDMIDKITINTTEVQLKPGDYLNTKINLDGYNYTNSNSTTYSNTWHEEIMLYISPGMFIPIHIQQAAGEMYAYDVKDALPFEYELPAKSHVQLKWTDPQDLTDWDPYPCTWEGTVIVRKEDSPPLHRWDGEKIVRTTTRDKYKTKPYKDENIVSGKTYYYAFMPYYTRYEDPDHPIRFYTFTKVIKVEIGDKSLSSTIDSIDVDGTDAAINYTLSQPDGGSFTSIKMYGKIGKNPKCDNTDDVVEDVDSSVTSLTLTGLESGSTYYFCLVTMDTNNKKLSSNVMSCYPFDPVPANIKPYISTMNDIAAYKFAWANIPEWYYARLTCHYQHPATKYSYSTDVYSSTVMDTFSNNFSYSGLRVSDVRTYNILTLNVTKNSGTNYTGRIDFPAGSTASIHNLYNPKNANASWMSVGVSSVESGAINFYNYGNTGDGDTTNDYVSYSGTLEQVFAWFADRFRNIDIYVDGVQFAKSHYDDT